MKTVYLVRHGESISNVATAEEIDAAPLTFRDAPLTPRGRRQAASMRAAPNEWNANVILTSPLRRAVQVSRTSFVCALRSPYLTCTGDFRQLH